MKNLSLTGLVAGLLIGLSACAPTTVERGQGGTPAASQPQPAAQVPAGPVLVGILAPLSASDSNAAELGRSMVNAARLALADAGNNRLRLEVYDTAGSPDRAAAVAQQAVSDGAQLLIGPLFAQSTAAVAPVARAAGINVISFSTDSSVAGDPVYLSGYLPEAEAERIASFAIRYNLRTVGVYYPQTPYGDAARAGMQQAARNTGMQVVAEQSYPRSFQGIQQTAGSFVSDAKNAGAEAVLLADGGQGLRSVGAFIAYAGMPASKVQYLGLGQWNSPVTLEERALWGGLFPAPDPDRVRAFLDRYATQYGGRPPVLAVLGYDAVAIAAQMLADSGDQAPFSDQQIARAGGFDGVFGPIRFSRDGRSERGMAILQVMETGFNVIERAPRSYGAGL